MKKLFADQTHKIKHQEEFLDILSEVASDVQYKELKKILTKEQKEELTMCIIADELVGQGRQAGLQEGRRAGQLDTICSLIKSGMLKIEEGAAFLNVTIEEMCTKMEQIPHMW